MKQDNIQASLPDGILLNTAALQRLQSDDLSLRRIVQIISQNKWPLLLIVGLLSGLSWVLLKQMPDIYEAEAQLIFEETRTGVSGLQSPANPVVVNDSFLHNQIAALKSREQGVFALVDLGLESSDEFNRPAGVLSSLLHRKPADPGEHEVYVDGRHARAPAQAYEYLKENLSVSVLGGSQVVSIVFRSESPQVAADMVNQLAQNYVTRRNEAQQASRSSVNQQFQGELADRKRDAERTAKAVFEFKARHGLDQTMGTGLVQQQISQLSTELVLVRTERVEAEARLSRVERLMRGGDGVAAIEMLDSADIRKLRDEELQLQKRLQELSLEYGPMHPVMAGAESQLSSVRSSLARETSRMVGGVRDEVEILRAKERSLAGSLDGLKQKIATLESHSAGLISLERDAAATQRRLDDLLARVNSAGSAPVDMVADPTVDILSQGYPALEPVAPKRMPLLALSVVGSGLLGLMFVFARDALKEDTAITASSEGTPPVQKPAVSIMSPPAVSESASVIPFAEAASSAVRKADVPRSSQRMLAPFVELGEHPGASEVAEASGRPRGMVNNVGSVADFSRRLPRSRYSALIHNEDGRSPLMGSVAELFTKFLGRSSSKTVMVTSPDRSDMRPLLAVACARMDAQRGQRVVLIDLDFAAPSLHQVMGDGNSLGLIDYLDGKISLGATIQRRQGIDLIYAGFRDDSPANYYDREVVLSMLELLARDYDRLILIAAPYLVSNDMRRLADDLDRTVYVLPEKARQNRKLLSDIVRSSKQRQKDAGVIYLTE